MSLTKRYLESLPQAEQDAILGGIDNAYISPDEAGIDADYEAWWAAREAELCNGCYEDPCVCLPDDANCDPE